MDNDNNTAPTPTLTREEEDALEEALLERWLESFGEGHR